MAITKVKDGWRVSVEYGRTLSGKRDRKTRVCKTKTEAKRFELQYLIERDGFRGRSNRVTFREFVEQYYLPLKSDTIRRNTMRVYSSIINNYLMPRFANAPIASISRLQVQNMVSACKTFKTAKDARDVLRQILSEAIQMELLTNNVAAGRFKLPEKEIREDVPTWLTSFADHKTYIEAATGDARVIMVLGFCFGLRKGEILGLDWKDIDFARREISIRHTYAQSIGVPELTAPKTQNSLRTIPMTDYAYRKLQDARGETLRIGPILTRNGARMRPHRAADVIEGFCKEHPELDRVTIFSMRHSFATSCIMAGVDVATVSKWLGHCDVTTTLNRYVKPLERDMRAAANVIDAAYK